MVKFCSDGRMVKIVVGKERSVLLSHSRQTLAVEISLKGQQNLATLSFLVSLGE